MILKRKKQETETLDLRNIPSEDFLFLIVNKIHESETLCSFWIIFSQEPWMLYEHFIEMGYCPCTLIQTEDEYRVFLGRD